MTVEDKVKQEMAQMSIAELQRELLRVRVAAGKSGVKRPGKATLPPGLPSMAKKRQALYESRSSVDISQWGSLPDPHSIAHQTNECKHMSYHRAPHDKATLVAHRVAKVEFICDWCFGRVVKLVDLNGGFKRS